MRVPKTAKKLIHETVSASTWNLSLLPVGGGYLTKVLSVVAAMVGPQPWFEGF
jgi:hypothetical protein